MPSYPFFVWSGINQYPEVSGVNNIGIQTSPFGSIYGLSGIFTLISQSGTQVVSNAANLSTGHGILSKAGDWLLGRSLIAGTNITLTSGTGDITITSTGGGTTVGLPSSTVNSGIAIWSGTAGGGFLNTNWIILENGINIVGPGSGNIKLSYSAGLLPLVSGQSFVGLTDKRFSGVFTDTINSSTVVISKFNEVPNGNINSSNTVYTFTFAPYSNSLQLYKNGTYLIPSGIGYSSFDYYISSGTQAVMTSAPVSGATLVGNYTYLG